MVIIGRMYESKHKRLKHTKQTKLLMISTNFRFLSGFGIRYFAVE